MGSIQEVKEALSAKAMTASLDDLRSRGRNQVRIIRAEHVAQMVAEAAERALADSGLVPHEELERLVQKSQSEFSAVKAERQRDLDESHRLSEALREAQAVLADSEARSSELEQRFQDAQARASQAEFRVLSLEERLASLEGTRLRAVELEPEMQRTLARLHEAELELEAHRKQVKQREPELASATRRAEEQEGRAKVAEAKAGQALRDLESARLRVESLEQRLDAESQKFTQLKAQLAATPQGAQAPQRELVEARARSTELERQLAAAQSRIAELERHAGNQELSTAAASAQVDVMAQVLEELATLKARVESQPQPQPVAAPRAAIVPGFEVPPPARAPQHDPASAAVDQLTNALSKLTQSMNDKMESFGRKMGISSAVQSGPVSLDGLFKDLDSQKVESNLDNLEVKKKQSGGIAANLERLKKLKGS